MGRKVVAHNSNSDLPLVYQPSRIERNGRLTLENECKFMQYFDSSHPKKLMRYSAHFKVMSMDFDSYEPSQLLLRAVLSTKL